MALSIDDLVSKYPVLWHVTPLANHERITRTRRLDSAAQLMQQAGDESWLRRRRTQSVRLKIEGDIVELRDQKPLIEANAGLQGGWTFDRLVEEINQRVFFWPGCARGPAGAAEENFAAFRSGAFAIIRVPTALLARQCRPFQLQLVSCNVGAPRMNGGRPAPRGPRTFVAPGAFAGGPAKVREVAVRESIDLAAIWNEVAVE